MSGQDARTCSTCGAPILWAVTVKGKRMPLDATPDAAGNIRLERNSDGRGQLAIVIGRDESFDGNRFFSHFATCPRSDSHRRSRNG